MTPSFKFVFGGMCTKGWTRNDGTANAGKERKYDMALWMNPERDFC